MTVCIAALCEKNIVFGVSDRMITSGDIQFEPPAPKIVPITSSIAVMTAGDAALFKEITLEVQVMVRERLNADPTRWLDVKEVAQMFVAARNQIKLGRAEAALLAPLGMTHVQFTHGAHGLGSDLAQTIARDMIQFEMPSVAFIVSGVDVSGAHIYTVWDGTVVCNDTMGFAAIGSGGRQAEAQFMLFQHAATKTLSETLLLAYLAKKRAEVAPGVGVDTDTFTIGPNLGTYSLVHRDVLSRVHTEYTNIEAGERAARAAALERMGQYVDQLRNAVPTEQEADADAYLDEYEEEYEFDDEPSEPEAAEPAE